jgi:hypothetical protein
MKKLILPGIAGALLLTLLSPQLNAQVCFGNSDVVGPYAFAGSRSVFVPVPATPPGTNGTGTTNPFSSTPVGNLLSGVSSALPFSTVGRIYADGNGHLLASAGTLTNAQIGTYSVSTDCTISVTLIDKFATAPAGTPASTSASATFDGIVLDRGNQIELLQPAAAANGAVLSLRRVYQNSGCTNATLGGTFGIATQAFLTGTDTTGTSSLTLLPVTGRLTSSGNGLFGVKATGDTSPLKGRQLAGTYTVNSDCTGTMQIVTADGVTRNASFVITRPSSGACQVPGFARPEILFGFTDPGVSGFGSARLETFASGLQ